MSSSFLDSLDEASEKLEAGSLYFLNYFKISKTRLASLASQPGEKSFELFLTGSGGEGKGEI